MARFYLFDSFATTISNASLIDVRNSEPMVPFPIGTNIPVRVDDSLRLASEPGTLGELLTLKEEARLAQSGFDNIIKDDFIESPQFDPTEDQPLRHGDRGSVAVNYIAYVYTDTFALGSTPPAVKLEFDCWWITYETDATTGKLQKMLTDVTNYEFPAGPLANVYLVADFGGSGTHQLTQGVVTALPTYIQGNTFTLSLRNYDYAQWLYSGGWALMY